MKPINFNYIWQYLDKNKNVIREIHCTINESLESAKSGLKLFGAYEVKKVKRFNNNKKVNKMEAVSVIKRKGNKREIATIRNNTFTSLGKFESKKNNFFQKKTLRKKTTTKKAVKTAYINKTNTMEVVGKVNKNKPLINNFFQKKVLNKRKMLKRVKRNNHINKMEML